MILLPVKEPDHSVARRKPKYKIVQQPIKPEIKNKFDALIKQGKEEMQKNNSSIKYPTGNLWRWDTLEDVKF